MNSNEPSQKPAALIGWRWLALLYDFFPMFGLWFAISALATTLLHGGEPIYSGTLAGSLLTLALWAVTGAYAMISWRRGGQTLGMRPWRLRVLAADDGQPRWSRLLLRYVIGTLSLLLAGLGFWWAWIDRDRLTWHDRFSGTRMRRERRTGLDPPSRQMNNDEPDDSPSR